MAKSLEMPCLRRLLGETLERMRQGGVTITAASAVVGFCVRLRTDRIFVASHAYLTLACNSSRRAVDINFNSCGSFLLTNGLICPTGAGSMASATCTPYRLATLRPASDNAMVSKRAK